MTARQGSDPAGCAVRRDWEQIDTSFDTNWGGSKRSRTGENGLGQGAAGVKRTRAGWGGWGESVYETAALPLSYAGACLERAE